MKNPSSFFVKVSPATEIMQGLAITTTDHRLSLALRIQSSCLKKHLKPTRVCFSNSFGSFPNSRLLLSRSLSSQKPIVPLSVTSSSSPSRMDRLAEISIVLENLNPKVRKPVEVLIEIEKQYEETKAKFVEERSALDDKYQKLYQPLLTKRCEIVDGRGRGGGVCCFWIHVLMNNDVTGKNMILQDLIPLVYLDDIKWSNISEQESKKGIGFKLEFYFGKNLHFKNTVLTKEYYIKDEYFIFNVWKIDGTRIEWYPGNEDFENFFSFFSPALYGRTNFGNKKEEEKLYYDFLMAKTIKNEIIPRAVSWFSNPDLSRKEVKNVEFLNEIQKKYDELEGKYMEEKAALEAKYQKLYQPLYTKRYEIVNGVVDVEEVKSEQREDKSEKGVPDFWLGVLKSSCSQVNKRDEGALKHLKDIKWSRIEEPQNLCSMPEEPNWIDIDEFFPEKLNWIKIEFFFDQNPYFKNTVLTKIYHILDGSFNFAVNKTIGTKIEWYTGNCLTMRTEDDKEFVSFFNFFSPASPNKEDCFAIEYKHEIIPHAVSLFLKNVKKAALEAKHQKKTEKLKRRHENV